MRLSKRVEELEREVKQLKCKHEKHVFIDGIYACEPGSFVEIGYLETCSICNSILNRYATKRLLQLAQIQYETQKLTQLKKDIEKE